MKIRSVTCGTFMAEVNKGETMDRIRELEIREDASCERWFKICDTVASVLKLCLICGAAMYIAHEVAGKSTRVNAELTTNFPDINQSVLTIAGTILILVLLACGLIFRIQRSTISSLSSTLSAIRQENHDLRDALSEREHLIHSEKAKVNYLGSRLKKSMSKIEVLNKHLHIAKEKLVALLERDNRDSSNQAGSQFSETPITDEPTITQEYDIMKPINKAKTSVTEK